MVRRNLLTVLAGNVYKVDAMLHLSVRFFFYTIFILIIIIIIIIISYTFISINDDKKNV